MTKIKSLIILFIAIAGAYFIYHHFDTNDEIEPVVDRFSSEYNQVSENNIFKYSTTDEILNTLEGGTGYVFLCTPKSEWCNYYAAYLNEALMENGIDTIYYYNIEKDRTLNTMKYNRILNVLQPYIFINDTQTSQIYMPDLTVVKNGNIIAHDNETSFVMSDQNPKDYWTDEKKQEFKNKIQNFVFTMNIEENIEEE